MSGKEISVNIYTPELLQGISQEVTRSGFKTRNRLINEVLKEILRTSPVFDAQSKLDEMKRQRILWEQLPYASVRDLAPSYNRTFEQMFVHIFQTGLRLYTDPSSDAPIDSQHL